MYNLLTNRGDVYAELNETLRCFASEGIDITANFTNLILDGKNTFHILINEKKYCFCYDTIKVEDKTEYARIDLYYCKISLYKALSSYFNKNLPWGSLTGIRPTRIAKYLYNRGLSKNEAIERMQTDYFVSKQKAELTYDILSEQSKRVEDALSVVAGGETKINNIVNLYVHIPFCPSRCSYCSFVSEGIEKKGWLLPSYVDALVEEIRRTKQIIYEQGKKIFSVYIGGGTPTVLDDGLLYKVLSESACDNVEFTCEAGRPDTITHSKLRIMNELGVNRISINPQTLHNKTLAAIGRAHTTEQFFKAYELAAKYGFVKNVDLIAGLDGETEDDFKQSLNGIIALSPENITVHTLCVKRGSQNALSAIEQNKCTQAMVDYSVSALSAAGYVPYYLYRQKQMSGNLENIGWCKPGCVCVNNVTVMEEMLSVYACGAGAISKLIVPGRFKRLANVKDVILYLSEFEERLYKKRLFYLN